MSIKNFILFIVWYWVGWINKYGTKKVEWSMKDKYGIHYGFNYRED